MKSLTTELVEIMTGVTPPKEWRFSQPLPASREDHGWRIIAQCIGGGRAFDILGPKSEMTGDNGKWDAELNSAFIVRAAQNFEPLVQALYVLVNDSECYCADTH